MSDRQAKLGGSKRRIWRKIHIGIDEETLAVRAVEVAGNNIGDAPVLPDLLNQIPPHQGISSVTADRTYDTRKCYEAIAAKKMFPTRKNAKPCPPVPSRAYRHALSDSERALELFGVSAQRYLGRTVWRDRSGYHRRSRVETKMYCLKLMGQSLTARDFDRQVAQIQIRIVVFNRYTALGIPITEAVA